MRDAVAHSEPFRDDGGEVGEMFELLEGRRYVGVWHRVFQFGLEFGEYGWVGQDVVR